MNSGNRVRKMAIAGRRALLPGLLLMTSAVALPTVAHAVNTCNALFSIDYVAGPNFALPGDVVRVRLTLGTASIQGGTKLTINRLRFDLDCNSNFSLGLPCTDEGSIVEYEGDGTITTTCGACMAGDLNAGASCAPVGPGGGCDSVVAGDNAGTCVAVTWPSNVPTGGSATNEIVFTPSTPVAIPANSSVPPGFCNLEFDAKVLARSTDSTPDQIEEVTGYRASQGDAMCNNGVAASQTANGSIPLCPTCDDQNDCTENVCNQQDGSCTNPPKENSTPCTLDDGNACTTSGCDGQGTCDENHIVKICQPDGNPCHGEPTCNSETGNCDFPNVPDSTPCPDTDGDPCTTAGCDGQGNCDQRHMVCVTTTTTSTTTTSTTTSTSTSSTTTTTTSSTTTTTACTPMPENCSNMIDDDCDGLIDCLDPDCPPCPPARKDPTLILFRSGLDLFGSHAVLRMPLVDLTKTAVGVLLTNSNGPLYSAELTPGELTPNVSGTIFQFSDPGARTGQGTHDGIYKLKIKVLGDRSGYTFAVVSYADLSAATLPDMRVQFYVGHTVFITKDAPWAKRPTGWRAPKDH